MSFYCVPTDVSTIDIDQIRNNPDTFLNFSVYRHPSVCHYFESMREINENLYCICISYGTNAQMFITEKFKKNSSITDNIVRCLNEELGATIDTENVKKATVVIEKDVNYYLSMIDIRDVKPFHNTNQKINNCPDDRKNRLTLILYGTLEEILTLLSTERDFLTEDNKPNDDIVGYCVVKMSDMRRINKKIPILNLQSQFGKWIRYDQMN